MSREKKKSLLLPLSFLVVALAVFGSIPYLTSRETATQQHKAAALRTKICKLFPDAG